MNVVFLYVPCPTEEKAKELARQLLEKRLVACANVWPVGSIYRWEGKVAEEKEWILLVKTTEEKEAAVRQELEKIHPYTVPCIASWPAGINEKYRKWVENEVKR